MDKNSEHTDEVLHLREQGYSYKNISEYLGISNSAIYKIIRKAVKEGKATPIAKKDMGARYKAVRELNASKPLPKKIIKKEQPKPKTAETAETTKIEEVPTLEELMQNVCNSPVAEKISVKHKEMLIEILHEVFTK
jgi:transcriptional regulator